jgi:dihydrofolate reductase
MPDTYGGLYMNVIVAVDNNWGIGKDGTQNIIIPEDRKYFREKTLGSTIIVGRRTVLDFPGQKPLPGRRNIILSRNPSFSIEGATVASSIDEVFRETAHDENVFVVGGAMVFHLLLNYCDTAYITKFTSPIWTRCQTGCFGKVAMFLSPRALLSPITATKT